MTNPQKIDYKCPYGSIEAIRNAFVCPNGHDLLDAKRITDIDVLERYYNLGLDLPLIYPCGECNGKKTFVKKDKEGYIITNRLDV